MVSVQLKIDLPRIGVQIEHIQSDVQFQQVQELEIIFLNGSKKQDGATGKDLFALMDAVAKLPQLTCISIRIERCKRLNAPIITYLLNRAIHLVALSLQDMTLKGNVEGLRRALMGHERLKRVRLSKVWCWPSHALVDALGNMPQLTDIRLDRVVLSLQMKPPGVAALSKICSNLPNLTILRLEEVSERVSSQLVTILDTLLLLGNPSSSATTSNTTSSVRKLQITLDDNAILSEEVVSKLALLIRKNSSTLTTLTLDWIPEPSLLPLLEALQDNTTLRIFRIEAPTRVLTTVSEQFVQASCHVLEKNTTLEHFMRQSWCQRHPHIMMYLNLNRAGRQDLLEHPNSQTKWYQFLRDHRLDINMTFYMLSRNPSILLLSTASTWAST
jgi:hypothetical protein